MVGSMPRYTEIMLTLFVGFLVLNIVNGFVLRHQDIVQVFQTKEAQTSTTPTPSPNVEKKLFSPAEIKIKNIPSKIQPENMLPKNNLMDELNLEPKGRSKKSNPKKRTPSAFSIPRFNIAREKPLRKFYPTESRQNCKRSKNFISSWSQIQFKRKLRKEPYKYFREVNVPNEYDKSKFQFRKKPTHSETHNLLNNLPITRPTGNNKKFDIGLEKLFNKNGDFENLRLNTYPRRRVTTTTERVTIPTERDMTFFNSMFRNNFKNKYHSNINDKIQLNAITDNDKRNKAIYRSLYKETNKDYANNITDNKAIVTANKNHKLNNVFHSSMLRSNFPNTIDTKNFNIVDNKRHRDTDNLVLAEKRNSVRFHDFKDNANNFKSGLPTQSYKILEFPYTLNLIATAAPKIGKFQNGNPSSFGRKSIMIGSKKWKGGSNVKFSTYSQRKTPNIYHYIKENKNNKQRAEIQMRINQSNLRSEQMPQSQIHAQILPNFINPDTKKFNNEQISQNVKPLPYSRKAFVDSGRKEYRRSYGDEPESDADSNENKVIPTHEQKTDHAEFENQFRLPIKESKLLPIKVYCKDDEHENKQLHEDVIKNFKSNPKKAQMQLSKGRVLVNLKIGLQKIAKLRDTHILQGISTDIANNMLPYGFRPSNIVRNHERTETFDKSEKNSNDLLDQKKNLSIGAEVSKESRNEVRRYKKSPHLRVFLDQLFPGCLG